MSCSARIFLVDNCFLCKGLGSWLVDVEQFGVIRLELTTEAYLIDEGACCRLAEPVVGDQSNKWHFQFRHFTALQETNDNTSWDENKTNQGGISELAFHKVFVDLVLWHSAGKLSCDVKAHKWGISNKFPAFHGLSWFVSKQLVNTLNSDFSLHLFLVLFSKLSETLESHFTDFRSVKTLETDNKLFRHLGTFFFTVWILLNISKCLESTVFVSSYKFEFIVLNCSLNSSVNCLLLNSWGRLLTFGLNLLFLLLFLNDFFFLFHNTFLGCGFLPFILLDDFDFFFTDYRFCSFRLVIFNINWSRSWDLGFLPHIFGSRVEWGNSCLELLDLGDSLEFRLEFWLISTEEVLVQVNQVVEGHDGVVQFFVGGLDSLNELGDQVQWQLEFSVLFSWGEVYR